MLNISRKLAMQCMRDKPLCDAVAMATMIKETYRNSVVYNATHEKLRSLFGVGEERLCKLLKRGLEKGIFFWREGNNLSVRPLYNRYHKNNIQIDCKCNRLSQAVSNIEKVCLLRHILVLNEIRNTLKDAKPSVRTVESVILMKKAKRTIRSMNLKSFLSGTSYAVMANKINKSVSTTRRLISSMIKEGVLSAEECSMYVEGLDGVKITDKVRDIVWHGHDGYLYSIHTDRGYLGFCRYGNKYDILTRTPNHVIF